MSRGRSFSEPDVLERVADLFTTHGYGGTSLAMLLEATGLGRQSLYNTFGDKRDLYLRAVDCATARFGEVARAMDAADDGRARVAVFFERLLRDCASGDPARQSCIVSAGLLEACGDDQVDSVLRGKWRATHALLGAAVERGQRDGSIAHRGRPDDLADLLMSLMSGLRVSVRAGVPAARLRRMADTMLRVLDDG